MSAPAGNIELTGILAKSDSYERLRLCLVDFLETVGAADDSWWRLRTAVPDKKDYKAPYSFSLDGAADDAGIRGECWMTLPKGAAERLRILALAAELRGREVRLTVRPKRYSFVSQARHNAGVKVAGTVLNFVGGLEAL